MTQQEQSPLSAITCTLPVLVLCLMGGDQLFAINYLGFYVKKSRFQSASNLKLERMHKKKKRKKEIESLSLPSSLKYSCRSCARSNTDLLNCSPVNSKILARWSSSKRQSLPPSTGLKRQCPTRSSKVRQPTAHTSILGVKSERMMSSGARRAGTLNMSAVGCVPAHWASIFCFAENKKNGSDEMKKQKRTLTKTD